MKVSKILRCLRCCLRGHQWTAPSGYAENSFRYCKRCGAEGWMIPATATLPPLEPQPTPPLEPPDTPPNDPPGWGAA